MRFKLDRSFYIPKNAPILRQNEDAIVYGYNCIGEKVGALAFKGKAQKPVWHYTFKNIETRKAYIDQWFNSLAKWEGYKAETKHKRQEEISQHAIKAGDYFYTSWGYDQTNIDYLAVVSVTAKTAICKMVNPIYVDAEAQQDVLMPGTAYGATFRMRINGRDSLVGSYPFCGDSSKRLGHFSKTTLTTLHRQTNPMFGH